MTDDELLSPIPATVNQGVKAAILERTTRQVTLVRARRRVTEVVACLVCVGFGWTLSLFRPSPERVTNTVYVPVPTLVANASGSPGPAAKTRSATELELEAEQITVKAEAARRFRDAGDRYLSDLADYRAALRCYRNFLDEAEPADRVVSPEDTWLLTSLKRAREQETSQ
ncbi:MAG TPA: hypothetical protein VHR66_11755 [Gemmataceae bacterium]|nr:hypothetical protein [Gemmataceae bacterium]